MVQEIVETAEQEITACRGSATMSNKRQNIFLFFMALIQLVQMIPLGAGINSGLVIGNSVGASSIQSVWVVASYPLTQGSFVLIGVQGMRYII